MAIFNEIGIGRWNRFIQKLTDMKGGPPARQLSSEIVFSHPISHGAENRYLESWQRFSILNSASAGGAGNRSGCMLRNPPGSNVVAVVERIACVGGLADQPILTYVFTSGSQLANPGFPVVQNIGLDNRGITTPTCQVVNSGNAGAILGVTISQTAIIAANVNVADFLLIDIHELPLAPNSALIVYSNVLNQGISTVWLWRERFLEPAERF